MFTTASRPSVGLTQLPIQWVPGAFSPGRQADYIPSLSAEDTNAWNCASTFSLHLYGMAQGHVYFTYTGNTFLRLSRCNDDSRTDGQS